MSKIVVTVAIFLCLISCAAAAWYCTPQPIIPAANGFTIESIKYEGLERVQELDTIDRNILLQILARYECRRMLGYNTDFLEKNPLYDIIIRTDQAAPVRVILGESNICLKTTHEVAYRISMPQLLVQKVADLLEH